MSHAQQEIRRLPAEYALGPEDQAAARACDVVFVKSRAWEKMKYVSKKCLRELMWANLAHCRQPLVVEDIAIPVQETTAAMCSAGGDAILKVSRDADRRQMRIVSFGHSHADMGAFLSSIDRDWGQDALAAGVGYKTQSAVEHEVSPDLALVVRQRVTATTVCTVNARGEIAVARFDKTQCPACGTVLRRESRDDVAVCIIGSQGLSQADQVELDEEVEAKVRHWEYTLPASGQIVTVKSFPQAGDGDAPAVPVADLNDLDTAGEPAPYFVYHHGALAARLPAALMEKVAAQVPEARQALGWDAPAALSFAPCEDSDCMNLESDEERHDDPNDT